MKCTCCQHAIPPICTCSKAVPKLDLNKPLMLSDGRKVIRAACYVDNIYALYIAKDGNVFSIKLDNKGRSVTLDTLYLMNIPKERYTYINIYPTSIGGAYDTREIADDAAVEKRIGCIKVKVEERFDN